MRRHLHCIIWLVGGLFAVTVLATLPFVQPPTAVMCTPRNLATETSSHGFFSPQMDDAGIPYVWTEPHAAILFTLTGTKPVRLNLLLRSAAIAGGPDAPVHLLIDGQELRQLHPIPYRADFQAFQVEVARPMHNELRVELQSEPFRPRNGDPRTLGTMVQSVTLDKQAAWSAITRRGWLYGALPILGILALVSLWIAEQTRTTTGIAVAEYAGVAACVTGVLFMLAAVAILLRMGRIAQHRYDIWLFGSSALGLVFGVAALHLPVGRPQQASLWHRLGQTNFVRRRGALLAQAGNASLFVLTALLALHFLHSPGTGDVQDKLRWMHAMASDGLVRGFQISQDDYPPGTYVILFAVTKIAPHVGFSLFLGYKLSLLFFLLLSSLILFLWTRALLLVTALQLALLVDSMALGYNDVFFIPFLLLALWALREQRLVWFSALFTITCLMKWQPIIIAPVLLIYALTTMTTRARRRAGATRVLCAIALPATIMLAATFAIFGTEFVRVLHRASSENFLSANALNVHWIVTQVLAWWDPQRFGFGPETHRRFIRVPNPAVLALLKLPFFAVYAWLISRFARGLKTFTMTLSCAFVGYLAYFMFNTSVHENHLIPAVVLAGLLWAHHRHYAPLFVLTAAMANLNMYSFYGLDGVPRLPVVVRGVDLTLLPAIVNVALFLVCVREGQLFSKHHMTICASDEPMRGRDSGHAADECSG